MTRDSRRGKPSSTVPAFRPHPLLRGGHAQTLAGFFLPSKPRQIESEPILVDLPDGDRLCLLDTVPPRWNEPDPIALLVHGLSGHADSPYMLRLAAFLLEHQIRVVRMNLRGAGAGFGLARRFYHSGRSDDVRAAVLAVGQRAPRSPVGLVGFSLGGNLVLKLAGEAADEPVPGLNAVLAANPPIDLQASARHIHPRYDESLTRSLVNQVTRLHDRYPELPKVDLSEVRRLPEFDEAYTAPRNGFASAADYYTRCSSAPVLGKIRVSGLVVHADDDPFIPSAPFRDATFASGLELDLALSGGHLGFISRRAWKGRWRWLDSRLGHWLLEHWDRDAIPQGR